jgi:hypothetical protein
LTTLAAAAAAAAAAATTLAAAARALLRSLGRAGRRKWLLVSLGQARSTEEEEGIEQNRLFFFISYVAYTFMVTYINWGC